MPQPDDSVSERHPEGAADADLILRTRSGDSSAFGELWRRHYRSGITVARSFSSTLEPDDVVQEAYSRIYQSIQRGSGPTGSFRAYLFTTIRNTAAGWGRARRETATDELDAFEDPATSDQAAMDALDRGLTHVAFRSLPSRWQEVLWYSEIEQMKPAEIAPLLGMNASAVAQLTFRARAGLRDAWVQAHLRTVTDGSDCQWTIERLGAYARGNVSRRDLTKIETHLSDCARCTIVAAEAENVSGRLAMVVLPLILGAGGAGAYLASLQHGAAASVAMAAMPSGVMPGAVSVPSAAVPPLTGAAPHGAGATSASAGASSVVGSTAAAASTGGFSVLAGLVAASVLIVGAVVGANALPGILAGDQTAAAASAPASSEVLYAPVPAPPGPAPADLPAPTKPPVAEEPPAPDAVPAPIDEPEAAAPDATPTAEDAAPEAPAVTPASVVAPAPEASTAPPVAPVEPVTPTEPAAPTEPVTPAQPTDPTTPTGPTTPTEPTSPTGPTTPTDPTPPTDPTQGPEDPTDPAIPTLPSGSPDVAVARIFYAMGSHDLQVALTLTGAPDAVAGILIDGSLVQTVTLDDMGLATVTVPTSVRAALHNVQIGVQYFAGEATGPVTSHGLLDLLSGGQELPQP